MSYRFLPHTADLRAAVEAVSLDELYASAAALVREVLVGSSPVITRNERLVAWEGGDAAERFFRFVRELLYLYDAEAVIPVSCRLGVEGVVVGWERFDPSHHQSHHQVKALTRHGFVFEERRGAYRVELVFDL